MTTRRDESQDTLFYMIKTVVRHSAVYGFFDMLGKITPLILVPVYVRVLSPADFGTLEIFVVTQTFLVTLLLLGFNSALVRYYTTETDATERRQYFRTALTAVLLVSAVAGSLLAGAAPFVSQALFGDATRTMHWRVLFATAVIDAAGFMLLALFRSQERPFRYSIINLARVLVILGLNILLVGIMDMGVKGALLGNLAGSAVGLLLGAFVAGRELGLSLSRRRFRQLAGFGMPLVVNGIAVTIVMSRADRYLLKAFGSLTDVGLYSLGYKVGMIMSVLVNAFVVAWLPVMFRIGREPDAKVIFSRVLTYYLVVTGFVLVAVSSYGREIVGVVARAEYARAAEVVPLILAAYVLQGVYYIASVGVTVTDRTPLVSVVAVISALVNLALNLVLIPAHGIAGAAWAALMSFFFLAVVMRVVAQRFYPIPLEGRRLAILLLAVTIVLVVNLGWIGHGTTTTSLLKLIPLALFPAVLVLGRFFDTEERLRVRAMIQRSGE